MERENTSQEDTIAASGQIFPEEQKEKQRKERRDKGQVLITPRDLATLGWIAEQYGIRLDQLQLLLGRDAQRETQTAGVVTAATAQRVVERWRKANLVHTKKFLYREPVWVWLTRHGLSELGFSYRYWEPNMRTLEHLYWINQVRLYVEKRRGDALRWISERSLRQEMTTGTKAHPEHFADAEILLEGATIGLEVELTLKKPADLVGIMTSVGSAYHTVWYFTSSRSHEGVAKAVAQLSDGMQKQFRIYDINSTL